MANQPAKDALNGILDAEPYRVIRRIQKGMSGDRKYYVETCDGKKMLRIADIGEYETKAREYQFILHLNKAAVPMPDAIDFGISKDGKYVYTLLGWIEGAEAEKILPKQNPMAQYALGFQSGQILRRIHDSTENTKPSTDWFDKYFAVIQPRLDIYLKEGVLFDGADKILHFIKTNSPLLHGRKQCGLHGDYHMGNLIVSQSMQLYVIDWHTVDFDNCGDPWYEFNRVGTEYPRFACGQIDGYFNNEIPKDFWTLFALYFSASAITSIVWAKYYAPNELPNIMKLNAKTLEWFHEMESCVPSWYTKTELRLQ